MGFKRPGEWCVLLQAAGGKFCGCEKIAFTTIVSQILQFRRAWAGISFLSFALVSGFHILRQFVETPFAHPICRIGKRGFCFPLCVRIVGRLVNQFRNWWRSVNERDMCSSQWILPSACKANGLLVDCNSHRTQRFPNNPIVQIHDFTGQHESCAPVSMKPIFA
jgi:hypothetical protein